VSHPAQPPAFDPDEDLFDFAGVVRQADSEPEEDLDEIFASFRDAPPAEELLAVPTASASHAPAPLLAPTASPSTPLVLAASAAPVASPAATLHAEPRPAEPAPRARATPDEAPPAERARETRVPAARRARSTKSMVAIALAVTLLNSALAVVALRRPKPLPRPPQADEHASEALAAPAREPQRAVPLPDPDEVDVAHAHPTLDEARAEIARGEYASARQRVYGLLAIIDRLEEPRRSALEGDCQFLIAQSLHLEALARMGESR
jgi:hypothetical protein